MIYTKRGMCKEHRAPKKQNSLEDLKTGLSVWINTPDLWYNVSLDLHAAAAHAILRAGALVAVFDPLRAKGMSPAILIHTSYTNYTYITCVNSILLHLSTTVSRLELVVAWSDSPVGGLFRSLSTSSSKKQSQWERAMRPSRQRKAPREFWEKG